MMTIMMKKHLESRANVQSSWRILGDKKRCRKEGFHGNNSGDVFPLILMDISMTHFLVTQLIHHPLSLSVLSYTMSQIFSLIVIHFYSYDSFSCVASSFLHGCTIVLTEAAHHDSILTHFLTHIILHTGRIFQQWHCNCIVCLVVESALYVYKGQFSPWFGQVTYYGNSHTMRIHHPYSLDLIKVQSKYLGNDRGTGNTVCFWPGVCWGMGVVLHFDTQP